MYTLPNGHKIFHLNKFETEYLYKEIFVNRAYAKNGIGYNSGDTIIDIGANIGMFELFVAIETGMNCAFYCFEPIPEIYGILQKNLHHLGVHVKAFNMGVARRKGILNFTFYPKLSVFSSAFSSKESDRLMIEKVISNFVGESIDSSLRNKFIEYFIKDHMNSRQVECATVALSDLIAEQGISKIDLLKIDAEKSELEIINGIRQQDWEMIKQIVVEFHETDEKQLSEVMDMLQLHGFENTIENEKVFGNSKTINLYAKKK